MATKPKEATNEAKGPKQGRSIVLPNGEKRADYIRRRYYDDEVERSAIAKELSEMQKKDVPYQIVFASTKVKRENYKSAA